MLERAAVFARPPCQGRPARRPHRFFSLEARPLKHPGTPDHTVRPAGGFRKTASKDTYMCVLVVSDYNQLYQCKRLTIRIIEHCSSLAALSRKKQAADKGARDPTFQKQSQEEGHGQGTQSKTQHYNSKDRCNSRVRAHKSKKEDAGSHVFFFWAPFHQNLLAISAALGLGLFLYLIDN